MAFSYSLNNCDNTHKRDNVTPFLILWYFSINNFPGPLNNVFILQRVCGSVN